MNKLTLDDLYDLVTPEIRKFIDFLEDNKNTIRGVYHDKFNKEGGWNGMMSAIEYVVKLNKYVEPDFNISIEKYPNFDCESELQLLIITTVFSM